MKPSSVGSHTAVASIEDRPGGVPEYILGITREIWEERGVGPALEKYYAGNVIVRAANGILTDNRAVAAATLQTLHEFPDRQLVGEDVVWKSDGGDGYLSSHRLLSVKRHTGDGAYGKATSRLVRSRIIAECWLRENQVVEEWLVRDQAAFANGLGMTAQELAQRQAEQDLAIHGKVVYFTPEQDVAGSFKPVVESGEAPAAYADGWRSIWQDKHPAAISRLYFPGVAVEIPGGETVNGHSDLDRFVISYLASFPDADFEVEQLMVNQEEAQATKLAMRWSLRATHTGWGRFGEPTGAPVYIMGLTHAHMVNGLVTMEWILIDEVSVWKQIVAHRKGKSPATS